MNYCMFLPVPMFGMPFLCQTKISSHHHQISLSFQNPTVSFLCSQGTLFITLLQCRPHINVHVSITHRNPRKKKSASIMPTPCRHFFRKHLAWKLFFPYLRPRVFCKTPHISKFQYWQGIYVAGTDSSAERTLENSEHPSGQHRTHLCNSKLGTTKAWLVAKYNDIVKS